jgi:hypothetical protein
VVPLQDADLLDDVADPGGGLLGGAEPGLGLNDLPVDCTGVRLGRHRGSLRLKGGQLRGLAPDRVVRLVPGGARHRGRLGEDARHRGSPLREPAVDRDECLVASPYLRHVGLRTEPVERVSLLLQLRHVLALHPLGELGDAPQRLLEVLLKLLPFAVPPARRLQTPLELAGQLLELL